MLASSARPSEVGKKANPLAGIRMFAGLPEVTLGRLAAGGQQTEPGNGTEIFTHGDSADSVYAIVGGEGRVRIGVDDRGSKKLMVEVFAAGDIFGEIGVLDAGKRTATAMVDGRVRLLRIPATLFMGTLNDTPALGAALSLTLAKRLRRTFALFQDATFETLEVRLARQLLYLATLQGRSAGKESVTLTSRLRQPDLADLLGATTRSIITILNAWRADGVVHYEAEQARLTIKDVARLRALLESGEA